MDADGGAVRPQADGGGVGSQVDRDTTPPRAHRDAVGAPPPGDAVGRQPVRDNPGTPACEAVPPYLPARLQEPRDLAQYHLNGTQDMLSLFGLLPLYDRAVRPYLRPGAGDARTTSPRAEQRGGAEDRKAALPKTYVHYVEDLPGKVRPPKRSSATRHQRELTQLLTKPEYVYTPIVPLDQDILQNAFAVEASEGAVPGIDTRLLEADEQESPGATQKRQGRSERTDAPKKRVVLISKKKRAG
ncbi:hypothetical protein MSPP1_003131 [Malassezia sp. CBS 17886]|nr:hypothetical protein MSPP1_003131 [Malassezia sp. CBS 17886]